MGWNLDKKPYEDEINWISFLVNHGVHLRMIFLGDPVTAKTRIGVYK